MPGSSVLTSFPVLFIRSPKRNPYLSSTSLLFGPPCWRVGALLRYTRGRVGGTRVSQAGGAHGSSTLARVTPTDTTADTTTDTTTEVGPTRVYLGRPLFRALVDPFFQRLGRPLVHPSISRFVPGARLFCPSFRSPCSPSVPPGGNPYLSSKRGAGTRGSSLPESFPQSRTATKTSASRCRRGSTSG